MSGPAEKVTRAREATTKLRDAARVIEFRERDRLVLDIHEALDLVVGGVRVAPSMESKERVRAAEHRTAVFDVS